MGKKKVRAAADIYLSFLFYNCRCFNTFKLWSDFHGKFASLEGALYEQRNQALVYKVTKSLEKFAPGCLF